MPKLWDDALKKLFRACTQDFVTMIDQHARVESVLSTELDAEHVYADGLLKCVSANGKVMLVHFEFQKRKDKRMGERMLEYNVLASRLHGYLPVQSCVIYLKPAREVPESPFIRRLPNGRETTRFYYETICLWELKASQLLEWKLAGLLPFLVLTSDGQEHATVDIMVTQLVEAGRTDLLWIGYALASEVMSQQDQEWLQRRFHVFHEILSDTPVYREVFGKGQAQGFAEGVEVGKLQGIEVGKLQGIEVGKLQGELQGIETEKMQAVSQTGQRLLILVARRFPQLEEVARAYVQRTNDREALLDCMVGLGIATTEQEARELLTREQEA